MRQQSGKEKATQKKIDINEDKW